MKWLERTPSRAGRDAIVIFGAALLLLVLFIKVQAFEYVVRFSETHEDWELDELLTVMMLLPLAMGIFAVRRLHETKTELQLRAEAEAQAQSMALHDTLTGLPNRRQMELHLNKHIPACADNPLAVIMVDLNRFKAINDLHGHKAGDEVLVLAGRRLQGSVGAGAFVARLGGDEFAIVLDALSPREAMVQLVQRVSDSFEKPMHLGHGHSVVGASIGVTFVLNPHDTSNDILTRADAAMYKCKGKSRNCFAFFEEGMQFAVLRRAQIEEELRLAIAQQRMEPFFQPIVSLTDQRIVGHEVLCRWRMDGGGIRLPNEFIGIAEDSGLIGEIYYQILAKAAQAVRVWPPEWRFAINVAPVQFDDDWLVERTLQTVIAAGVAPARLDIEITESALASNIREVCSVIANFQAQGVKISLDDFGTGYSSLRLLSELAIDRLKIDRSFVRDLSTDPRSRTIVRTIVSMARNLGLSITVEGIETEHVLSGISEFDCDNGQGFYFGKPKSARETARLAKEYISTGPKRTHPNSDELEIRAA